ncbi:MAG: MoaD/ThiS family protein [Pseudomonadota bacterium]
MIVNITAVGALTWSLPSGKGTVEGESLTVQGALHALIEKYGQSMADELLNGGELRQGLSLLVNGRNVLSLPDKFQTSLKDGDEVIIATIVVGG